MRLRRAFHVSWTNAPHVLDAAFHSQSFCWPVIGSYMTPPWFSGRILRELQQVVEAKPGCDHGPWNGSTSSPNQPS